MGKNIKKVINMNFQIKFKDNIKFEELINEFNFQINMDTGKLHYSYLNINMWDRRVYIDINKGNKFDLRSENDILNDSMNMLYLLNINDMIEQKLNKEEK